MNNNKQKCKIIYNNLEYELTEYFDLNNKNQENDNNNKNEIKIKLKGINNITNMSCIFDRCKGLYLLPDISKWDTSNIIDISLLFNECKKLSSLPDI